MRCRAPLPRHAREPRHACIERHRRRRPESYSRSTRAPRAAGGGSADTRSSCSPPALSRTARPGLQDHAALGRRWKVAAASSSGGRSRRGATSRVSLRVDEHPGSSTRSTGCSGPVGESRRARAPEAARRARGRLGGHIPAHGASPRAAFGSAAAVRQLRKNRTNHGCVTHGVDAGRRRTSKVF